MGRSSSLVDFGNVKRFDHTHFACEMCIHVLCTRSLNETIGPSLVELSIIMSTGFTEVTLAQKSFCFHYYSSEIALVVVCYYRIIASLN